MRNAGLSDDPGTVADVDVPDDPDLPGQDRSPADPGGPETPTWAIKSAASPTWTLCATWTRLSILAPAPMRVAPKRPRSMATFAPISTSSSTTTVPHWGIFSQPVGGRLEAEAVRAEHRVGVDQAPCAPTETPG